MRTTCRHMQQGIILGCTPVLDEGRAGVSPSVVVSGRGLGGGLGCGLGRSRGGLAGAVVFAGEALAVAESLGAAVRLGGVGLAGGAPPSSFLASLVDVEDLSWGG